MIRASYDLPSSSQEGHRHDYGRSQSVTEGQGSVDDFRIKKLCYSDADNTILPSNRAENATRSLSGHLQSQPEGFQQFIAAQRVPDPCRSVEKLHEFLPDCEKIPGPSQHLQVTQWMASIDGKEEHDTLNSRMEEKQPSTTQTSAKNSPSGQQKKFQREKPATTSGHRQRKGTSHKALHPGLQDSKYSTRCHGICISDGQNNDGIKKEGGSQIKISEMISHLFDSIPELYEAITDIKSLISDKNSSICSNIKNNNLSLSQINESLMCCEKVLRTIKTSNNDNSFGNKINEQSATIKEFIDKYPKFNVDDIIETGTKQAINIIKTDNKKVLDEISNSFTEAKTYTIALKKCFDSSQEEVSKLSMKLNQVTADNTRQTELWQELTHKEAMYKIEIINLIQAFQHEYRNSQRCSNSKMNDIEQIQNTLPRMSTPLKLGTINGPSTFERSTKNQRMDPFQW
ncbi:hypothetical protein O181_119552 [Austropuccinia psidii MF-1]|uniref:Uncharacterized protein n=1 Tax=Austropuccinia psidii MF-1 TaxID=1389203 RepID=A0A9Q3KFB5_9BASI|nr:hypothetical protein [Austropuccinia psidii MF-1]